MGLNVACLHLLVRRLILVFIQSGHVHHRHFFVRFLGRRVESGRFRYGRRVDRFLFVRRLFLVIPPTSFFVRTEKRKQIYDRVSLTE